MVSVEPREVTGKFASFDVHTGLLDVLLEVSSRARHDDCPNLKSSDTARQRYAPCRAGQEGDSAGGREQFEARARGLTVSTLEGTRKDEK